MSAESNLYLPPELWLRVLRQHTEPEHLWTHCRQVSSAWRTEVHHIFRERYLQDPIMTELRLHPDDEVHPNAKMHFDRFDTEDDSRCVFTEEKNTSLLSAPSALQPSDPVWTKYVSNYLSRNDTEEELWRGFKYPAHSIRVKGIINDTELPGIRVDYDKGEVSFQWLPMFERLFREAHAIEKGIETWMQSVSIDW